MSARDNDKSREARDKIARQWARETGKTFEQSQRRVNRAFERGDNKRGR